MGAALIGGRVSQRAALFLKFVQKKVDECMIELPHVCLLMLRRDCSRFYKFIVRFKKNGQRSAPTHSHPCDQHTVREKHSDHYWCSAKAPQGSKCSSQLCVGCFGCCVPQPHNLGG